MNKCFKGTDGLGLVVGTYKAKCGKGFLWVSWRGKCLRKSWTGARSFHQPKLSSPPLSQSLPIESADKIHQKGDLYQEWSKQGQFCHPVSLIQRCLQDTHRKPGEHSSLQEKDISQFFWWKGYDLQARQKHCEQLLTHLYAPITNPVPFTGGSANTMLKQILHRQLCISTRIIYQGLTFEYLTCPSEYLSAGVYPVVLMKSLQLAYISACMIMMIMWI